MIMAICIMIIIIKHVFTKKFSDLCQQLELRKIPYKVIHLLSNNFFFKALRHLIITNISES